MCISSHIPIPVQPARRTRPPNCISCTAHPMSLTADAPKTAIAHGDAQRSARRPATRIARVRPAGPTLGCRNKLATRLQIVAPHPHIHARENPPRFGGKVMELILIVLVLFLLFGGGGYWGY